MFTNLLLADEINRTPPKTQSALLEAMEERQVSVDGEPRPLPDPFVVVATQNPIEHEGTYPLPEAQLDRFLFKITLESRRASDEVASARHARASTRATWPPPGCGRWPGRRTSRPARAAFGRWRSRPEVLAYIVDMCRATRQSPSCSWASHRAARPRCWPRRGRGPGCPAART